MELEVGVYKIVAEGGRVLGHRFQKISDGVPFEVDVRTGEETAMLERPVVINGTLRLSTADQVDQAVGMEGV